MAAISTRGIPKQTWGPGNGRGPEVRGAARVDFAVGIPLPTTDIRGSARANFNTTMPVPTLSTTASGRAEMETRAATISDSFDRANSVTVPGSTDNAFGGSAHGVDKGGLTAKGREMIERMDAAGMVVDVAHASAATIDDVLAVATRPIVASHTGVRGTADNARNLSDAHLRGIAASGGVIGIGFWDTATGGTDVASIIRAIAYAVDVAGSDHVGLGSDFDGAVTVPIDAAGLVQLTDGLLAHGFDDETVGKVMGRNALRVLEDVLPA